MAAFSTKKIFYGSPSLIPTIADRIKEGFESDGYEVAVCSLSSGGYDISITKGGVFKAILGMKTALKITLLPGAGNINFEAGVGIWGQQAIPTVISMLFFWPVILTQIWGMVEQSKLDDKAVEIAEKVVYNPDRQNDAATAGKFCHKCGAKNPESASYCSECGTRL